MRNFALAFCMSALLGVGLVACGDDSSASAVDTPSSESALLSSSADVDSSSSTQISSESKTFSSSVENEARSSSDALSSGKQSSSSKTVATSSESAPESSCDDDDDDDGKCTACDSYTAADPELTENGGKGSVTTYGSITAKETSLGGACNYGQTNIRYYAAIHVNVSPGDEKGPWNCGVDLGGAPAADIMGNQVGRYYGEWEFVSCEGVDGVWGDSTSIWVKEGASEFWSIIQVRNPKDMVKSIAIYGVDTSDFYELEMVVGTENFWTVPEAVLQTDNRYRVVVKYRTGTDDEWKIKGSDLAVPEANLYLYEYRE